MMHLLSRTPPRVVLASLVLAGASFAQSFGPEGLSGIEISFYTDPTLDAVFRCTDDTANGNYNQQDETRELYLDVVAPPLVALVALSEPRAITISPDDTVFVGDEVERIVLAINDVDEDGTANELGEHWIYFDGKPGGNAAGLTLAKLTSLSNRTPLGAVWVASSSTQTGELEQVFRLEDRTLDLDANDATEATVFCTFAESAPSDREVVAIREGLDGAVYVLDVGLATPAGPGVYRLQDLDSSGSIDAPGETTLFLALPSGGGANWVALDQDESEAWFALDRGNGKVWRAIDADQSGAIEPLELHELWSFTSPIDAWDIGVNDEGGVFVGDIGGSIKALYGQDFDLDGTVGSGETINAYDVTIAPVVMLSPVGVAVDFHDHGGVGEPFCTASSITGCPCNNSGAPDAGCINSTGLGAHLEGEGSTGVGNDDLELHVHDLPPNVSAVAFYGFQQVANGNGQHFRDGLRCVAGAVRRIGVRQADTTGFAAWGPGLAASEGFVPATTYHFQVWYRDPTGPCGTAQNFSNGLSISFDP